MYLFLPKQLIWSATACRRFVTAVLDDYLTKRRQAVALQTPSSGSRCRSMYELHIVATGRHSDRLTRLYFSSQYLYRKRILDECLNCPFQRSRSVVWIVSLPRQE